MVNLDTEMARWMISKLVGLMVVVLLLFPLLFHLGVVNAQDEQPAGPVYLVQEGDTLWDIAQRFGVPWEDLARENDITDPGQLTAGDELIIPGLQGVNGILTTEAIPFGENLRSLTRRYRVPAESLIRLNHITSQGELFIGGNLIIPQNSLDSDADGRISLAAGESLLELAAGRRENPWELVTRNGLPGTWAGIPGDVLYATGGGTGDGPGALPGPILAVEMEPEGLSQGKTVFFRLEANTDLRIEGSFIDYDLHFFKTEEGDYVALQGIHALETPGMYPLVISGELENGIRFGFSQRVWIGPGDYIFESLTVPPETLDPANTGPEDAIWNAIPVEFTSEKLWQGEFLRPVAPSDCGYTDYFGNRRSYNGSAYNYFHTGLDFCYNYNLEVNEIYAPADGIVVFAQELVVRGNATMIDHGWGIYTAYMHQAEILVEEGESVKAGQVIGITGGTGRVNGPHLHFEVWVGGVQVDPLDWLEKEFP
jgi:murein DD-endopeptidase MepM/ murein hydrolase activator NlpD